MGGVPLEDISVGHLWAQDRDGRRGDIQRRRTVSFVEVQMGGAQFGATHTAQICPNR